MSLSDKEILELNQLCNALIDETLTENQEPRLSTWLDASVDARRFYLRATGLSASLFSYASEMQTEAPDAVSSRRTIVSLPVWLFGSIAAAASLALVVWLAWPRSRAMEPASRPNEFVAQLTGLKQCQWKSGASSVRAGDRLLRGQRLELARGFAEITFDSGAQVVLEGPATFVLKSAWEADLSRGTLKASVPPQALGFRISNPSVEVVDLGTEFTISTDDSGAAEVLVLKGQVEAQASTPDRQPIVLREKESRRFASSGISALENSEQRFAQFAQPISLDRFEPPTDCVHWSFDETSGGLFRADASGIPVSSADALIKNSTEETIASAHSKGHLQGALRFDGHLYARAQFRGIADYAPHTVVFWVKVPKDANLANAYAMVAWGVNSTRLGSHPIHIGWNRNPTEGTVGVLRTDYGGGYAIGATPLRDGRWHHIGVVLLPRDDAKNPLEVNQYVDGRLEGEGKPSPPGSEIFTRAAENVSKDTFWLGCRLGVKGVRSERFCGEMDELFIADRALEPQEIVRLMTTNELQPKLASATNPDKTAAQE
jgi:hypothetical protein